jgi:glycosyltransferase involved in cell wall biosynthesis
MIRREAPSIIHLLAHTNIWLNLALPFRGDTPLATTVHDVNTHPGDRQTAAVPEWASGWTIRQSDDLIVHGEGLRRAAIARFGAQPARVHALPHPAIPRYAELARREGLRRRKGGPFTVLLFGRLYAYKGLRDLVLAEAALGDRAGPVRFVIAGAGDDPGALRELMGDPERYDVRRRFIEDRETAQLFLDADLVALPYVEASQSGVLNIAATFGRPVVATDVGELRATIEGARMGLVTRPGDPGAFADAIASLAARPKLAAELGANARAWAEGPNAPGAVGFEAARLYRAIIARAESARADSGSAGSLRDAEAAIARTSRR